MPEEPDLSPEDIEILDRNIRKRIEAKKRQREAEFNNSIADRILQALQARPDGMHWAEIRGIFDENCSEQQIRQALRTLTTSPAIKKVEQTGELSGERFLLAAS